MTSYYDEIRLSPSVDDPMRLIFIATADAPPVPGDVAELRKSYDETARIARLLFTENKVIRAELFLEMHRAADRGLRGPRFSVDDGKANLETIQQMITDQAHIVRDKRLKAYSWLAVYLGVVPLLLGIGLRHLKSSSILGTGAEFVTLEAGLYIAAGATICVWAEFVLRMHGGLTFDQLANLDISRWNPGQRVLITIGVAFIFAFLLAFQAVQVGVGNLLLNDYTKEPILGLAVGGFTGFTFGAVRDLLYRLKPEQRA